eukprot:scaffold27061_cov152-Skeletonema_menzelii.AAC.10
MAIANITPIYILLLPSSDDSSVKLKPCRRRRSKTIRRRHKHSSNSFKNTSSVIAKNDPHSSR